MQKLYSKIGSRDCQVLMNKLLKDTSTSGTSLISTLFINTLIVDKNLEECKKLVSQGVSIYRSREIEHCYHHNSIERCYNHCCNPDNYYYAKSCFCDKLNDEINTIIYYIIEKLSDDVDKALEYINWIVYEYPSRIGYKIKVEEDKGREYLDTQIKEYCEKYDKMDFYQQYLNFSNSKVNNKLRTLYNSNFYIDPEPNQKGEKNILCTHYKDLIFVMFYNSTELVETGNNVYSVFSSFVSVFNNKTNNNIKFGKCDVSVPSDTYLNLKQTVTIDYKKGASFILYNDGRPMVRYEGLQTVSGFYEFINELLTRIS
jgi:hypothetical protein